MVEDVRLRRSGLIAEIRRYDPAVGWHRHDYAQLIIPIDGSMAIETRSQAVQLAPGRFLALSPGAEHGFSTARNASFLVFDVQPALLAEMAPDWDGIKPDHGPQPVGAAALRFLGYYSDSLRHDRLTDAVRGQLARTALLLLAQHDLAPADADRYAAKLSRIAEWIAGNPTAEWSVPELAQRCGLSRSQFTALFHQRYGRSPKQMQMDSRLVRAAALLREGTLPISVIAQDVGYPVLSAFTRSFTRRFGVSPSRFRIGEQIGKM
jgi:AraC-like DNA-binding protein